jgi:outer membrane protein
MFERCRLRVFATAVALLAGGAAGAAAQGPDMVTLGNAQQLAVANYEAVQGARERLQEARYTRRQADALRLPTVAVNSVFTRNFITGEFTFSGQTIRVLPAFDYNLAIAVSQPVFTGLRTGKMRQQAAIGEEAATRMLDVSTDDAVLDATRAYYRVLGAQENVEISARAVAVTGEMLRTAESLYRAGEAVETAVLRARVAATEARREALEAANGLELARQQLALITGIEGDFHVVRPPRPDAARRGLEDLIALALQNRPEIQALAFQRRISELEVEKRHGQYLPTVTADAMYLQRRASFPSSQLSSVSINATWLLFNGGRTAAEVAVARSGLHQIELQLELLRKQTRQQVRAAYMNVDTHAASVDMLTAQVDFARRNAESTARAYRVGEATDLDLLEANATLTRSERQLALTTYALEVGIYELQRAVGSISTAAGAAAAGGVE